MPYCSKCGRELAKDANYCHFCGAPVSVTVTAQPTHQTFAVTGAPRVLISNYLPGSVEVVSHDQNVVDVDFNLKQSDVLEWTATQNENLVTIGCRARRGEYWPAILGGQRANISVKVPRKSDTDLTCRFGDVSAKGIQGNVLASTSTGGVQIRECDGYVEARTKTGAINLDKVNARVIAENYAGSINYSGTLSSGESSFRTKVGAIELVLSGEPNFAIEAHARVGTVTLAPEFKATKLQSEQYTIGHRVYSSVGLGNVKLFAETYTGTISIRRPEK